MNSAPRKNPDRIRAYLQDLEYPAGKEEILLRAQANQVPDDVMEIIIGVADRKYQDHADLLRGVYEV